MSRRDTGFPDEVKALVLMRSDGRCEACGERTGDLQYHHRRARGMGSTRRPDTNTASNCLTHCKNRHEFSSENTYIDPGGNRHCRTCSRDRKTAWQRERRRMERDWSKGGLAS